MNKKIAITGGTGLIGRRLAGLLSSKGYEVVIISRGKPAGEFSFPVTFAGWDIEGLAGALDGSAGVVNLAGANVGAKWTAEYKQEILRSRIESTSKIVESMKSLGEPPKSFFSMSAVGYYGDTGDRQITEDDRPGSGFLAQVCSKWENEALKAKDITRLVIGRTGVVLDADGGALNKLLTTFKSYIGGALGSGRQWMPWIHAEDVAGIIYWAIENDNVSGTFNITGPNPVRMEEFARTLGKILNKPSFFRVPAFVIKALMGESASIVLDSCRALPARALHSGYGFRFQNIDEALRNLLNKQI